MRSKSDNNTVQPPSLPDEFYGARRDLRLQAGRSRPHPLDGSSSSSSEAGMQREFMASPRHNMMMGGNKGHEQYMRTVVDMRYWQGDYMGYESTTAAETHSVTGRS